MRITRLGEGVDATHKLNQDAIERTLVALGEFRKSADELGVVRARMAATSAVRDAVNGQEFLDRASQVVGVPAELLPGDEEGRLAYQGATKGLPPSAGDDVVVDIGGGSTELVTEQSGAIRVVSMDIGCVRLTERFLPDDPPLPAQLQAADQAIEETLERSLVGDSPLLALAPGGRLIGLAGTVSTLASLEQGLSEYDYEQLHHSVLTEEAVRR